MFNNHSVEETLCCNSNGRTPGSFGGVMMTKIQTIQGGQKDVSSLEGTKFIKRTEQNDFARLFKCNSCKIRGPLFQPVEWWHSDERSLTFYVARGIPWDWSAFWLMVLGYFTNLTQNWSPSPSVMQKVVLPYLCSNCHTIGYKYYPLTMIMGPSCKFKPFYLTIRSAPA